jgi:8-oxo-dGTP pyrophosphatase MutT (NUDIX family)
MEERVTARLLLLDPHDRILLMQVESDGVSGPGAYRPAKWITPGGRIEDDETIYEAASREAKEETGQTDIELGPIVWYGEHTLIIRGVPHLLTESFLVARTGRPDLSD